MNPSTAHSKALDSARVKAYVRLLPLLFICYIIAYIDRTNVAVAKLTMAEDLPAFTETVFGFGYGIFFWGYFLLEIPGTLIVERWSARKWICRIMVTWGIMAAITAFVTTPMQFYIVRFLLGVAEAGFFPGVIVYLTHWFPAKDRAPRHILFLSCLADCHDLRSGYFAIHDRHRPHPHHRWRDRNIASLFRTQWLAMDLHFLGNPCRHRWLCSPIPDDRSPSLCDLAHR